MFSGEEEEEILPGPAQLPESDGTAQVRHGTLGGHFTQVTFFFFFFFLMA